METSDRESSSIPPKRMKLRPSNKIPPEFAFSFRSKGTPCFSAYGTEMLSSRINGYYVVPNIKTTHVDSLVEVPMKRLVEQTPPDGEKSERNGFATCLR